ncbi:hypothetical protein ACH4E7_43525 [Kitasatospora sp. NPDC018058]|uniref:hypothetical protein n=1 Tax=Kitasatospora sp. NPDC018058 TaxID=3364025 RepID=UPI0037BE911A
MDFRTLVTMICEATDEENARRIVAALVEYEGSRVSLPRQRVTPTTDEIRAVLTEMTSGEVSVLLTAVAARLSSFDAAWRNTGEVRALLAKNGIRVRDGVRTPNGNGPGVHHEDVSSADAA